MFDYYESLDMNLVGKDGNVKPLDELAEEAVKADLLKRAEAGLGQ